MDAAKVVAHFINGTVKKGYTRDFSPNKSAFHLVRDRVGEPVETDEVILSELKAVFFVKTFAGDPGYRERKEFAEGDPAKGQKVEVTFTDGEILQGSVSQYTVKAVGFFFFPVDPKSNNLTLFVVSAAVKKFRYLRFHPASSSREHPYQCLDPETRGTLLMLSGEERTLLKLLLPRILEADSAREYIVENLGSPYLQVGEALLREVEKT